MHQLSETIAHYGIGLVFANVLVEQLGIPLPALPTLIVAGALASQGELSALSVFFAAFTAALIADTIWFTLGGKYGRRLLNTLCRVSISPDSCVRQTEGIFERWGVRSLIAAKFVAGFSTVAPALSGMMHVRPRKFFAYDTVGVVMWAGSGIGLGFVFHGAVDDILDFLDGYGRGALVILGSLFVLFILFKWWHRWRFFRALRMARISPEELHGLMGADSKPVVVDVRSATGRSLDPRRIPGARLLDAQAIDGSLASVPKDREVVVYCTCPNEASAARVARALIEQGFKRVRPLEGGLDAWLAAGFEVEAVTSAST
jgi:membrane protein DedA with SNARE-associated domain/rhodanese-related sulfurtransferase